MIALCWYRLNEIHTNTIQEYNIFYLLVSKTALPEDWEYLLRLESTKSEE